MTYTSFCVFYDKGTDISLPVFTDSDEDSLAMNRFYSAAAGDIYSYITGLLGDGSAVDVFSQSEKRMSRARYPLRCLCRTTSAG